MITLRPIDEANFRAVVGLRVKPEQEGFVASNVYSLAQAWLHPDAAMPWAIYADDTPVGFYMGSMEEEAGRRQFGIWRFMIDHRYQGKGYGRQALALAIAHLRGLGAAEISLSYEPENAVAAALYASAGFVLTGEMDGDEIVAKLVPDTLEG